MENINKLVASNTFRNKSEIEIKNIHPTGIIAPEVFQYLIVRALYEWPVGLVA